MHTYNTEFTVYVYRLPPPNPPSWSGSGEEDSSSALLSCFGYPSWRDIIHSFWRLFQSSPGGAGRVRGVCPEASWGLGWCGFHLARARQCSLALLQVQEAAKNGNFVNLISMPPVLVLVLLPYLLSHRLQRLIHLLWLYWKVEFCGVSHLAECSKMVSFPFHGLAAILGRGGFLPRTPDTVGWCRWILFLEFLWVG